MSDAPTTTFTAGDRVLVGGSSAGTVTDVQDSAFDGVEYKITFDDTSLSPDFWYAAEGVTAESSAQ